MIKRTNNKNKKGFTLIELIIVLAVMAIIALIAIPNFSAVRENSKTKADKQSCETIERTVLMLVSDETIKTSGTAVVSFDADNKISTVTNKGGSSIGDTELDQIKIALSSVKKPQTKDTYEIVIDAGKATVKTTTP